MLRRLTFGLAFAMAIAEPLSAQSPDSLSLDMTLGLSAGSSNRVAEMSTPVTPPKS